MKPSFFSAQQFPKEQDSKHVVLLLFIFLFPYTACLPHAHITAALCVLLGLGIGVWQKGDPSFLFDKNVKLYFLFLCFSLSGVVIFTARKETLLAFVLRLSFFLPFLFPRVRQARLALSLGASLLGVLAVLELFTGRGRVGYADALLFPALSRAAGPLGNPNLLAAFLLPPTLLSLAEALFSTEKRLLYFILFLGCCVGILATFSRGAMLALLVSALLLLCQKYGVCRLIMTAFAVFPLSLLLLPASLCGRLRSFTGGDSSVFYRFSLWKSVLRTPPRTLIFGTGEGKRAMLDLLSPHLSAGLSHVEHTHSLYLHLLISVGSIGLLLFLWLLFRALRKGAKRGLCAALFSLLIFGIFDDPLYSGHTEVLFWTLLGCCAKGREQPFSLLF